MTFTIETLGHCGCFGFRQLFNLGNVATLPSRAIGIKESFPPKSNERYPFSVIWKTWNFLVTKVELLALFVENKRRITTFVTSLLQEFCCTQELK